MAHPVLAPEKLSSITRPWKKTWQRRHFSFWFWVQKFDLGWSLQSQLPLNQNILQLSPRVSLTCISILFPSKDQNIHSDYHGPQVWVTLLLSPIIVLGMDETVRLIQHLISRQLLVLLQSYYSWERNKNEFTLPSTHNQAKIIQIYAEAHCKSDRAVPKVRSVGGIWSDLIIPWQIFPTTYTWEMIV